MTSTEQDSSLPSHDDSSSVQPESQTRKKGHPSHAAPTTQNQWLPCQLPLLDHEKEALRAASQRTEHEYGSLLGSLRGAPLLCWDDHRTLASLYRDADEGIAFEQFAFVARLLANRGIPSLVLEDHLDHLAQQLKPKGETAESAALLHCATLLQGSVKELIAIREEYLCENQHAPLMNELLSLGLAGKKRADTRRLRARLLLCAVIDDENGASGAKEKTMARLFQSGDDSSSTQRALREWAFRAQALIQGEAR